MFFYFLFFIFLNLVGQDRVLLSISETDVSIDDFMKTYNKNRLDTDSLSFEDSLKEYLDLYINFKLKVVEAESLGLDTIPSFIRELEGYRRQLVKPYLTDSEISDQLLKEAYERLKDLHDYLYGYVNREALEDPVIDWRELAKEFKKQREVISNYIGIVVRRLGK